MQIEISENRFDAGAVELNIARAGRSERTLILLHGATGRWQSWVPVVPEFAGDFGLVMPDMRGSGKSGRTPEVYGVRDMASDILALIDAEAGETFDLIGHSFGGHVALCVAAARPERVRRLVLEEIPLIVSEDRLAPNPAGPGFAHWLSVLRNRPGLEALETEVAAFHPDMEESARRTRVESLAAIDPDLLEVYVDGTPFAGYDPHELAAKVGCPVLVLQADPALEPRIGRAAAQLFCDLAPDARRKVMTGSGHGIHTDDPAGFVREVSAFLEVA